MCPSRKRGFVPGNRRSTRHWYLGIYAAIFLLWAAVYSSIWGWGLAIGLIGAVFVMSFVFRSLIPSWIARKLDPFKGTRPGDRVKPVSPNSTEVTDHNSTEVTDHSPPHSPPG